MTVWVVMGASRVMAELTEDRSGASRELNSSWDKVTGEGALRNCSVCAGDEAELP